MKLTTTATTLALLTIANTTFAETSTADCDGWSMTGTHQFNPDGLSRLFITNANLQHLVGNEWVVLETSHDCGLVGPAPGMITMGNLWTGPLQDGNYRVSLVQEVYLYWWDDLATAKSDAESMDPAYTVEREGDAFLCEGSGPGVDARTPGYWKNHAEAWGQSTLLLGDAQSSFSQNCLLELLSVPTKGDARVKLSHHLIAAKLNMLAGSNSTTVTNVPSIGDTILDTIDFADEFLISDEIHCDGFSGPKPRGLDKAVANGIKDALDAYNNNAL
ncbi:MAG: hypothetical protein ACI835_000982 [Planctomycetota bacterium]|jgi:hypothetical protein